MKQYQQEATTSLGLQKVMHTVLVLTSEKLTEMRCGKKNLYFTSPTKRFDLLITRLVH